MLKANKYIGYQNSTYKGTASTTTKTCVPFVAPGFVPYTPSPISALSSIKEQEMGRPNPTHRNALDRYYLLGKSPFPHACTCGHKMRIREYQYGHSVGNHTQPKPHIKPVNVQLKVSLSETN